ncbi:MAG: substrate-binding domain-containing protein [Cyanobacteria bacterium J06632_19]
MAIVKLKIRESKEGFHVDLTARELYIETEGDLPPLPAKLETSFNNWQLAYREIDAVRSVFTSTPSTEYPSTEHPSTEHRLTPKNITKYSSAEYTTSVKDSLNQWLNSGDCKWLPVRDILIAIAQQLHHKNEEIRVIIDAEDVKLRRLPWQEWNLFEEHYPQVEIALSAAKNTFKPTKNALPQSSKIRVLVVVGRSDGINTQEDLEVIKELEQHGAEVVCLMKPNLKDLCEALREEQGYHIFIFTGHSGSQENGHIGWIELNDADSLSIEEFKEALKQAINKGLQLAIFNSCDGLGLASQLAHLHLPRCIVMREPVPDKVAVAFLKYFFKEFTCNQSLSTALNKARKQLEHFNLDYPGAMWLPTICIAPNVKSLTWKSLNARNTPQPVINQTQDKSKPKKNITIKLLVSLGLIGLFVICSVVILQKLIPVPSNNSSVNKSSVVTENKKLKFASVNVPSGTFRYGGSTTWETLRKAIEPEISQTHPQFKLQHQGAIGSGAGIKALLKDKFNNGSLDFVLSSRHLKQSEIQSGSGNFKLKEVAVVRDGIAIAVNHGLKIAGLTIENLRDIYTGKIRNWKDVGGPDLAILPLSRNPNKGGTPEFFVKEVLRDGEFGQNTEFVNETTEALRKVEINPGAIYYASAPAIVPQCGVRALPIGQTSNNFVSLYKEPIIPPQECKQEKQRTKINQVNVEELKNNYPRYLTRKLYVIYKQTDLIDIEPDLRQESMGRKAALAYIKLLKTDEGKKLIEQVGFAPIH